jgi:hypothetical protein
LECADLLVCADLLGSADLLGGRGPVTALLFWDSNNTQAFRFNKAVTSKEFFVSLLQRLTPMTRIQNAYRKRLIRASRANLWLTFSAPDERARVLSCASARQRAVNERNICQFSYKSARHNRCSMPKRTTVTDVRTETLPRSCVLVHNISLRTQFFNQARMCTASPPGTSA